MILSSIEKHSYSRQTPLLAAFVLLAVSSVLAYLLHVNQEDFGVEAMNLTSDNVQETIVRGSMEDIRDVFRMSNRMAKIKSQKTAKQLWDIDAERLLNDLRGVESLYLLDSQGIVIAERTLVEDNKISQGYDFKQKQITLADLKEPDVILFSPIEELDSGRFVSYAFAPIYGRGQEKQATGYIGIRVCIAAFIKELLFEPSHRTYLLKIYFNNQLVFKDKDVEGSFHYKDSKDSFTIDIDGNGQGWKYEVYPVKHIAQVFRTPYPFVIMIVGVLISLLVYSLLKSKAKSKQRNQELIDEVQRRKESESQLREARTHNSLTKLPNQYYLRNYVSSKIADEEKSQKLTLFYFDLDSFKDVNSSFGHGVGDRLLQMVGQRIQPMVGEGRLLAHLGSDEFAICVPQKMELREAESFGCKILSLLEESFEIDQHVVRITASVGVAAYPKHADSMESLLLCVDTALQRAKDFGKNHVVVYSDKIANIMKDRMSLLQEIHDGISKSEFCMFYQPKFDTQTQRLTGVEALLRWKRDGEYVLPSEFLGLINDTGLILNIGMDTMERACIEYLELFGKKSDIKLALNLAAKQVEYPALVEQLLALFGKYDFPLENLELELTEQSLIQDFDDSMLKIHRFSRAGISIAIDDFGVGYSSLSYLKRFPIDILKIDKSFVLDIVEDKDDLAIVKTIIAMGHGLGLQVVAEGVETEQQMEILKQEQCDQIQGFLLGKPLSLEELTAFYENQTD